MKMRKQAGEGYGEALYSSKIIKTFIKLVKTRYSYVSTSDILSYAGMSLQQVEDEGHWFSQEQTDRFYERLVQLSGDANIAREAGRYSASPQGLGLLSRYVLGLAGPATVFGAIGKIAGSLTRSSEFKAERVSSTEIELVVIPKEGIREKPYQCDNRIGYFEAIIAGFNYRAPKIDHYECIFNGDPACRYRISWRQSATAVFRAARTIAAAATAIACLLSYRAADPFAIAWAGIAGLSIVLILSICKESFQKKELDSVIYNLRDTAERFFEEAEKSYNQALMVNEIGYALSSERGISPLLTRVMEILKARLDFDRGIIMLADDEARFLEFRAGFGYGDELFDEIRSARFSLEKPSSRGAFVMCYRERKPILVDDVEAIERDISRHSMEFLQKIGAKSFVCCPIMFEDKCYGVLAVDNVDSKRPLVESDMNLLMGIAPELGMAIHSAILNQDRDNQFRSILRTLAASIDARDNLTAGHSERVTEYAVAICEGMGLSPELTDVIQVAAQLHDYGKIGIKDSILKKRGPLTGKEREEIKTHVVKTQDILSRISFSGIYQQVPFIAGSHHERLDGTGYPRGLRGEEIPIGARVLAVADFFEAISAKRHYHEALPRDEAISTLKDEVGHHLDEAAVRELLRALESGKIRPPDAL
jgi:HD-GYP domain-containing protein (c-di-GMP phosphodiesterase class II)